MTIVWKLPHQREPASDYKSPRRAKPDHLQIPQLPTASGERGMLATSLTKERQHLPNSWFSFAGWPEQQGRSSRVQLNIWCHMGFQLMRTIHYPGESTVMLHIGMWRWKRATLWIRFKDKWLEGRGGDNGVTVSLCSLQTAFASCLIFSVLLIVRRSSIDYMYMHVEAVAYTS